MAFDAAAFVAKKQKSIKSSSFDTNAFLKKRGIQPKVDLSTQEGLIERADQIGLGDQAREIANPPRKLSAIRRISAGLGAFNTGNAQFVTNDAIKKDPKAIGPAVFLKQYGKDIATGIGAAVTGRDLEPNRKAYRDVAEQLK